MLYRADTAPDPQFILGETEQVSNKVKCPVCSCSFFEQIKIAQFDKNHNLILGQMVPATGPSFILLRCVKCKELVEPNLIQGQDWMWKIYSTFLDEIEGKQPL